VVVRPQNCIPELLESYHSCGTCYSEWRLLWFCSFLQSSSKRVLKWDQDRFLPNPLQFIIL
jgi:hypothetical protein